MSFNQKKDEFLKEETKVIEKIPRLNILRQIYGQVPLLYELNSDTKFILSGWKATKDYIKSDSWKLLLYIVDSFTAIYWQLVVQAVVKPHFMKN